MVGDVVVGLTVGVCVSPGMVGVLVVGEPVGTAVGEPVGEELGAGDGDVVGAVGETVGDGKVGASVSGGAHSSLQPVRLYSKV